MGMNLFHPKVDIVSGNKEYTITAELPGLEEKDVRLHISVDGLLVISGEKRQEAAEGRGETQCVECSYGAFERALSLPDDVDREGIEARFRNGVLTVTCPRTEAEHSLSRQIPLSASTSERSSATIPSTKKAA